MNKGMFARILPHLVAVLVFLIVAVIYCKPVLQGKVVQQHDVTQWRAMAQNSFEYKEKHGHFPLWTNGMFSGMPAYQIAMEASHSVSPGWFYYVLTLGLPKPVSFFFLACICFYFLAMVLRVNPYAGMIGALAFAYATYNPIIIAAGHDTKMQSIALMPALIGAVLLLFEGRYLLGGALTALSASLLIGMNHPQIAYYTFLILVFMTIAYIIYWVKTKQFKQMLLAGSIALLAALAGVGSNAVMLMTTYEYAKESIRGGSDLASASTNTTKTGLSKDYALSYSVYKTEPLVMMVPHMYGGSSSLEVDQEASKAIASLRAMPPQIAQQLQYSLGAYWGGIGGTSGPPYVGAIICFLALIGFFLLGNRHKWWILAATVITIMMSWGSYFESFNGFLLKYLPMYNKFRAPSMILVVPTLLFCMLAVLTLDLVVRSEKRQELWDRYKKGLMLTGAVFVVLLLVYTSADFRSEGDRNLIAQTAQAPPEAKSYVDTFLSALREDRKGLFMGSLVRSFLFIAAAAAVVWFAIRKNGQRAMVLGVIGLLAFIDVIAIDAKYLGEEQYKDALEQETTFTPSAVDAQVMQDTSYYRVFDVRQGIGSALGLGYTLPSYFHHSVGGYHPAKLSIYQDLIENQLSKFPQSLPVYNMLNTKYIIQADNSGQGQVYNNPEALGAAWFVKGVRFGNGPAEVMGALNNFNPRDTAILFAADQAAVAGITPADSASSIRLLYNDNDEIAYAATSGGNQLAVFSEIFYNKGWKAYIDGKESPILRVNYVLRGLVIPAGQHQLRFEFKPASYYTGNTISLVAGLIVLLALAAALLWPLLGRTKKVA